MNAQKPLRLTVGAPAGERHFTLQKPASFVPREKLLADLIKREARSIMGAVTECPPDTVPAHLERLDSLLSIVALLSRHEFLDAAETRLSGTALIHPATVADYAAALQITRRQHRAPAFATRDESALEQINRKLDVLAGLISRSPEMLDLCFAEAETEGGAR